MRARASRHSPSDTQAGDMGHCSDMEAAAAQVSESLAATDDLILAKGFTEGLHRREKKGDQERTAFW